MDIKTKKIPVKIYYSISKIKRYHVLLRRVYDILIEELLNIDRNILLQIVIKTINNTASLNGLTPTLLVWGVYPKINRDSALVLSVKKKNIAYRYIKIELEKIKAKRQVNNTLGIRNGPNKKEIKDLLIQSDILV
jgi:hypothetical protein